MGVEFFEGLEKGACFRYEIDSTLTFSSGEVQHRHCWLLAEYRGRGPRGEVLFVMWDHRRYCESNNEWKLSVIPERLEHYDPDITEEHLATEVWLNRLREKPYLRSRMTYAPSGWTLGDLVNSTWVNRHVHDVSENCIVDLDRYGTPQLWNPRACSPLTIWREVDGIQRPVIDHWDRWDVMDREEQAHRVALRVVYLQQSMDDAWGPLSRQMYANELVQAQREYDALSGGAVIPLEVLNAGRGVGEQLALL